MKLCFFSITTVRQFSGLREDFELSYISWCLTVLQRIQYCHNLVSDFEPAGVVDTKFLLFKAIHLSALCYGHSTKVIHMLRLGLMFNEWEAF